MKKPDVLSAVIYLGTAAVAGLIFFIAALISGYSTVERIGGAVWVFLLSTIILMPVVIPRIKKKYQ